MYGVCAELASRMLKLLTPLFQMILLLFCIGYGRSFWRTTSSLPNCHRHTLFISPIGVDSVLHLQRFTIFFSTALTMTRGTTSGQGRRESRSTVKREDSIATSKGRHQKHVRKQRERHNQKQASSSASSTTEVGLASEIKILRRTNAVKKIFQLITSSLPPHPDSTVQNKEREYLNEKIFLLGFRRYNLPMKQRIIRYQSL